MKSVQIPLGGGIDIPLPDGTDIYRMASPGSIENPGKAIRASLDNPVSSPPLAVLARDALDRSIESGKPPRAVILVSDNTRPVPYSGEQGILLPVVELLLREGFKPGGILVIVATGTHRAMTDTEIRAMVDPEIFRLGITVENHDCKDTANLTDLGTTSRGGRIYINRKYLEADLKILTGLVESHFMAGFSGGRKSVCPGVIGEESTFVFHGADMMAHPEARDLVLDGNPCHEESLEVARRAGADFIVNVTLDHSFNITGVFAGELEAAHRAAAEKVRSYVGILLEKQYDIVISHAGFVGVNHYQAAKVGVASIAALKEKGHLIVAADNTDTANPVGSLQYRTVLQLLKLNGPEKFLRMITSADWTFIPEQWQVQMWAKLFSRIPMEHFYYFAPQIDRRYAEIIPGRDGRLLLPADRRDTADLRDIPAFIEAALRAAAETYPPEQRAALSVAYLSDGPYGIPCIQDK
ncbi:nickel-dependent lactate racemase [Breznakiella homolactica]|uniref:Nickel-dependent lactate racemase n=1 Tax=Breznakiella homolactica TaxID=2798577 RepID=A0A7T7XQW3_9SPIR|nr:nickel-dependent lactate racemase [Breznakiella homolactica]QQO10738.1 nickel-dependent lactate racemase [Breznakiella homolactica]